jgi:hypothetical protein
MSETKGLYQVEDEPDAAPEPSVSAPVSAMGKASAPLRECPFCGGKADLHIDGLYNVVIECEGCHGVYTGWPLRSQLLQAWNRRDGEAARVAEAVAAERERIVAALRENIARHKEAFDLHRESRPLLANEHNAARWGLKKAIAIALDEDAP